jgi:hypothetical protein
MGQDDLPGSNLKVDDHEEMVRGTASGDNTNRLQLARRLQPEV